MKKRLIKADDNTDNVFSEFKKLVDIQQIAKNLHNVYISWQNANMNKTIDEAYDSFDDWFEDYYDSIVDDCINDANENVMFHEKYMNLSVEEQESLSQEIKDYIHDSKQQIHNLLTIEGE